MDSSSSTLLIILMTSCVTALVVELDKHVVEEDKVGVEEDNEKQVVDVDKLKVEEVFFTKPESLMSLESIMLGLIIINIKEGQLPQKVHENVDTLVDSLLLYSSGESLGLVIITDHNTVYEAKQIMETSISKFLTMGLIKRRRSKLSRPRVPIVKCYFVNIADVIEGNEQIIETMKKHLDTETNKKYHHDLFFLGPIYHTKFVNLTKLIFLDIDLVFHSNVLMMWRQFSKFSPSQCLGIAPDLSPHYRSRLKSWRDSLPIPEEDGGDLPGDPGALTQGLNTGVTLFNLDCLRDSQVYSKYTNPVDEVSNLIKKYELEITLGDQDWFTLLGFEEPSLFYPLPCQFNVQMSVQYLDSEWAPLFYSYNYCTLPHKMLIQHRNGCGPKIEHCRVAKKRLQDEQN